MQYLLLIYETAQGFAERTDEKKQADYWAAWPPYAQALREAGVLVGGQGLQPAETATTVRRRDGQRHVQDGPYADTKEQLGGYFLIDAPHLDAALDWAARCPVGEGACVEVRPMLPSCG